MKVTSYIIFVIFCIIVLTVFIFFSPSDAIKQVGKMRVSAYTHTKLINDVNLKKLVPENNTVDVSKPSLVNQKTTIIKKKSTDRGGNMGGMGGMMMGMHNTHHKGDMYTLMLTSEDVKRLEVETFIVQRKIMDFPIYLAGELNYDERKIYRFPANFSGRIDKLYVNYEGISIKKDEPVAKIWSPDLIVLQKELLQAVKESRKGTENSRQYLNSVIAKMKSWKLTEKQIKEMVKRGTVSQHVTLYSPFTGIVTEQNYLDGQYFSIGSNLYTVADISHLWLRLDAWESNIALLKLGQRVEFSVKSYPGETFYGKISFISPYLYTDTRTVFIRADIKNPELKLKPGMYASAKVYVKVKGRNKYVNYKPSGKKPKTQVEVTRRLSNQLTSVPLDGGMVQKIDKKEQKYLNENDLGVVVIPITAPLITGKRSVVYLQKSPGIYEGIQVVLGHKNEKYFEVISGLKTGDIVVTSGNFQIDTEMQVQAKASMMSPESVWTNKHKKLLSK
ncbi:MAG: efflux RND transporter periplasmic adaptor subunit [bacterium]|nr:efflux RND transporter periplasmic adaptor subunit [bacterium]